MCGLFAWSSIKKKNWTPLSKFKFELLGVEMDSRGGDGCGITYDGNVKKSEVIKKFDDFWRNEENVPSELSHPCIIGHDRKASVGEKTFENTQPICFIEEGKGVKSILAHNGTLHNHEELYEKHKIEAHYDVDPKGMSDSQMLALLIDKIGWKILNEYIGSAAIIYSRIDEPGVMYLYHGKSSPKKGWAETEERPLFYGVEDDQFWVCSTKTALEKILRNKDCIKELPFNAVYKVSGVKIEKVCSVDRSKSVQSETTVVYCGRNARYTDDDDVNSYYEEYLNGGGRQATQNNKVEKFDKITDVKNTVYKDNCSWDGGIFKLNGKPAHGQICMSRSGFVSQKSEVYGYSGYKVLYFFLGNMCRNRHSYIKCEEFTHYNKDVMSMKDIFHRIGGNFADAFFIPKELGGDETMLYDNTVCSMKNRENVHDHGFYGIISPLFTSKTIQVAAGKIVGVKETNQYRDISAVERHCDEYPEIYEEWKKEWDEMLELEKAEEEAEEFTTKNVITSYACPNCFGEGKIGKSDCNDCGGTGVIDPAGVAAAMDFVDEMTDYLSAYIEEDNIFTEVYDTVEEGIDILEEADLKAVTHNVYDKLVKIKEILLSNGSNGHDL